MSKHLINDFSHFDIIGKNKWLGNVGNEEKSSGVHQHFLVKCEYLVHFKSSSAHFSVACFHSSDVKDHINLLIFKSQKRFKGQNKCI